MMEKVERWQQELYQIVISALANDDEVAGEQQVRGNDDLLQQYYRHEFAHGVSLADSEFYTLMTGGPFGQ
jgi:hypothetical protein